MFNKYVNCNRYDLRLAISEGRRPMTEFFDDERDGLPFFENLMTGENYGNRHFSNFSMAHIPGRWLDALLNAEDVLGEPSDDGAVRTLEYWAYRAMEYEGLGLPCLVDIETGLPLRRVDLHNLREQMRALCALVKFRSSDRAYSLALKMINTVNRYFDPAKGDFDCERFETETGAKIVEWPGMTARHPFPATFGRYIGPLVKFYLATGELCALEQAQMLKDACFKRVFTGDFDYDPGKMGAHTHSVTSTMSSLCQLYDVTGDAEILKRVKGFMENGLKKIALDFGWCIENFNRRDCVGEINNTADIMETCLILGKHGVSGSFSRAERILRGHLLPSQLLDTCFIPDDPDPRHIATYNLPGRARGAFGFPTPYSHEYEPGSPISFNWDIVGGAVSGLCEAYRSRAGIADGLAGAIPENNAAYRLVFSSAASSLVARRTSSTPSLRFLAANENPSPLCGVVFRSCSSVNLLFDFEDDNIKFASPYGRGGEAALTVKRAGLAARVRVPENSGKIEIDAGEGIVCGEWLYLKSARPDAPVIIRFEMPEREETSALRNYNFRALCRGEEITAFHAPGKRLCFFKEIK